MRNTDSFFQDDSLETKKISLTPNLLRDDSNNGPAVTNEPKEVLLQFPFPFLMYITFY